MAGFAGSKIEVAAHRFPGSVVESDTPVESSTSVEPDISSELHTFVEVNREQGEEAAPR
jgi:hypothetical protein